ncbi:MAG TPA: hypothetical protein EYH31_00955 [Anaerolineae bacterium]|nr:hypothetical protein [Anaerolineae bacterium]
MRAQGHNHHLWLMLICCLIPIAALGAIFLLNVPVSSALLFALILLCPLAHLLLMGRFGHAHGTAHNAENGVSGAPAPPSGGLRPKSERDRAASS